jgi:SAM-dependent methyltransferase
MTTQTREFVAAYLREAPLFAAIVRRVECALLRDAGPLERPLLDLGAGDGLFAALAFAEPPDCGVDLSPQALAEARARHAHDHLLAADATRLPFPAGAFATVVSNSVFEHIPDLDGALDECRRVLAPGGRLLLTAPSHDFGRMLLGSRIVPGYARWFNGHSRHFHTLSLEEWDRLLTRRGFRLNRGFYYLSPRAHRIFDAAHYLSGWRWLCRRLTGRWTLSSRPWLNAFWERWLGPLTERAWPAPEGPYLFVDANRTD